MKKSISLLIVLILLLQVFSVSSLAATESNAYIRKYSALLSNPSSGVVQINFSVYGTALMSSLGAETIELYENGSLVKTFSRYDALYASSMATSNAYSFHGHVSYSGTSGSSYYAIVTVFASDGMGTGYESCTTGSIVLP